MVSIQHLSKAYRLYDRPWHRLAEWATGRSRHRVFWALKDVNIEVPPGVALGIVGPNGAGKSTLLKILSGVSYPTEGAVTVPGKIAALLELGTGFHPELTGRENVFLNGRLLGYGEREIADSLDEIISFSELGEFIDQPVRTYSSGMYMRLGFSIAASLDPSVLVVDEIFAVGDAYFQQKCVRRLREFKERGATILFVSHDPSAVKTLCDQAVLIHRGEVVDSGRPDDVLDYYNALLAREHGDAGFITITRQDSASGAGQRAGTFEAVVTDLRLLDQDGHEVKAAVVGQSLKFSIRIAFLVDMVNPTVGILIRDRLGTDIFGTNTYHLGQHTGLFKAGDELETVWDVAMDVGPGQYTVTVAVHTEDIHLFRCFDWADAVVAFQMLPGGDYQFVGKAHLGVRVALTHRRGAADVAATLRSLYKNAQPSLTMNDEEQLLHGWHSVEESSGHAMRWSKGSFAFVLRGPARAVCLEACCPRPGVKDEPVRGRIWVNGAEAGEITVDSAELRRLTIPVQAPSDDPIRVDIRLDEAWVPHDHGVAGDKRELGLYVLRAWTEQTDSASPAER
jgi:lipopolysaccharide transport system ATP-binding protein